MANPQTDFADFGIADPDAVQQQVQETNYKDFNDARNQQSRALVQTRMGMENALGNPNVNKAKLFTDTMKGILSDVNEHLPEDADPDDKALAVSQQVATKFASLSPQVAMQALDKSVQLTQAKKQQQMLAAQQTNYEQQAVAGRIKNTEAALTPYVVYSRGQDENGLTKYDQHGEGIPIFNSDGTVNPDNLQKLKDQVTDAQKSGAQNVAYMPLDQFENAKGVTSAQRAQASVAAAQIRAAQAQTLAIQKASLAAQNGLDKDGLEFATANWMLDPTTLARQPTSVRNAVMNLAAHAGVSPADAVAARMEVKSLQSAADAVGTREGNVALLQKSIAGAGDLVTQALSKVERTDFPKFNAAIVAGKEFGGNKEEKAYAAAVQTFVNEYSRLIAGGTGVTSDAAREEAMRLLSVNDAPGAVQAVKRMAENEADVIGKAASGAVETLAHPERYAHIIKVQERLGIRLVDGVATYGNGPPSATSPSAAPSPQSTPSSGGGPTKDNSVRLKQAREAIARGADEGQVRARLGDLAGQL